MSGTIGCIETCLASLTGDILPNMIGGTEKHPLTEREFSELMKTRKARKHFAMIISALDSHEVPRMNVFTKAMISNLVELNRMWEKAKGNKQLENSEWKEFKEVMIDGYDVQLNFEEQVRAIEYFKTLWGGKLTVVVGRGKTTGEKHINKLKEMCKDNEGVTFRNGYWPADLVGHFADDENILMISMGIVMTGYLPPGSVYAPTEIIEYVNTDWKNESVKFLFVNEASALFPPCEMKALAGIMN